MCIRNVNLDRNCLLEIGNVVILVVRKAVCHGKIAPNFLGGKLYMYSQVGVQWIMNRLPRRSDFSSTSLTYIQRKDFQYHVVKMSFPALDLLYQIVKFDTPHYILSRIFDLTSILASIEVAGDCWRSKTDSMNILNSLDGLIVSNRQV